MVKGMVKGIISAFDHMELCLVINLTKKTTGARTITPSMIIATVYVSFAATIYTRWQVLATCKKS